MYLTLEVVSPQAASMGADQRKMVGPQGITIGRVPGNGWVIPDPYISKQHARISFANGVFYVESVGRNPISIGQLANVIANNQPRGLKNGDRLFIDQYEMLVGVKQGDMPGSQPAPQPLPTIGDDPFALDPFLNTRGPMPPVVQPGVAIPDVWDGPVPGPAVIASDVDPLVALGGGAPQKELELPSIDWQQSSPLDEHLSLPPIHATPSGIPDNWERSGHTHVEPIRPSPAPATAPRPQRVQRPAQPQPQLQSPPQARAPIGVPPPAPAASPPPRQRAELPVRDHAGQGMSASFAELLRGAGLNERDVSPELLNELGRVLRIVVQGTMEILQSRSEIKSQFRIALTRVKAAENNPLKFSPNVESALHTLLVQRNSGYLETTAAFDDAFVDIRSHQMAMLEGMRSAFQSMLESFSPAALEREFEGNSKRGGLLASRGGKAKFGELYAERFARLAGDPDDTFRRLFGDVFAEAYEKQLERLRAIARHQAKTNV